MGFLLEGLVKNDKKRMILEFSKSIVIVIIFIWVISYYLSGSTYTQGWNDCVNQIRQQWDMFPDLNNSNFSINFSIDYLKSKKANVSNELKMNITDN
jgi:hypothetical protein